ncbi:MAG TPA: hypothetical protein VHD87_03865 [Acidimicrobiales bacterium]|nr:hypothetical protein [Acidimicrobiales bacterium]
MADLDKPAPAPRDGLMLGIYLAAAAIAAYGLRYHQPLISLVGYVIAAVNFPRVAGLGRHRRPR